VDILYPQVCRPVRRLRRHSTKFRMCLWREHIQCAEMVPFFKNGHLFFRREQTWPSPIDPKRRAAPYTPRERELPRPSARSLSCHSEPPTVTGFGVQNTSRLCFFASFDWALTMCFIPWATALARMSLVGQTSSAAAPRFSLLPLHGGALALFHPGAPFVCVTTAGSSRLIHRVGDAGRLWHGFCLTARKAETARITRQRPDELSIAMRTSVVLWCKGSELRSVRLTRFTPSVTRLITCRSLGVSVLTPDFYSLRTIPLQVPVQVATGNEFWRSSISTLTGLSLCIQTTSRQLNWQQGQCIRKESKPS
jgi:hypothetical protein